MLHVGEQSCNTQCRCLAEFSLITAILWLLFPYALVLIFGVKPSLQGGTQDGLCPGARFWGALGNPPAPAGAGGTAGLSSSMGKHLGQESV